MQDISTGNGNKNRFDRSRAMSHPYSRALSQYKLWIAGALAVTATTLAAFMAPAGKNNSAVLKNPASNNIPSVVQPGAAAPAPISPAPAQSNPTNTGGNKSGNQNSVNVTVNGQNVVTPSEAANGEVHKSIPTSNGNVNVNVSTQGITSNSSSSSTNLTIDSSSNSSLQQSTNNGGGF